MITFLLTIVITAILLSTLLTYTLYCYEETNQTGEPLPRFLAMAGRTALRSIVSEALIILLHPIGLWPRLWSAPTSGRELVVMVHGLFHNQSAWIMYRRWLHAHGFATVCISYSSWGTQWEDTAEGVRKDLQSLLDARPDQDVHLIGHSMGGLLLKEVLTQVKDTRRIRSLVTLGTPFQGSKLWPFALTSLGRYLKHEGETVRRIKALPIPAHVRCLALRSPADNMVLPNTALRCELSGWKETQTLPVSHVAMLHAKSIFRETLDWIRTGSVK